LQSEYRNRNRDSCFALIDYERGALRLLVALLEHEQGLPRQQLTDKLQEQGVGRTSLNSSLDSCKELGLVVDVKMQRGSRHYSVAMLTEEGYHLARKLQQIKTMLDTKLAHDV